MTGPLTPSTTLPPVAAQVRDITRALIALPAHGLTAGGKVKIGDKRHVDFDRDIEGKIRLYVFGVGNGLISAHSADEARELADVLAEIAPALRAFADAVDGVVR